MNPRLTFHKSLSRRKRSAKGGGGAASGSGAGSSGNPASAGGPHSPDADGAWDCPICTFRNNAEAFKCSMCDVRKGTSTR